MPNTEESSNGQCPGVLSGKKVILGVSGGIAAYKAAYLASGLTQRGADVHVVMTEHATRLVGPPTFWSLTANPVITDLFEPPHEREITHVSLPESADLLLIAPATANIIAKLAYGLADDMLSTMALVVRCPVIIAPAMNVNMYTNPVVAANLDRLRQREWIIVEPDLGRLACGDTGVGRLADPEKILTAVEEALTGIPKDYAGLNVLVSAGPTREPIDPVRYITNRSSGKMGYAIAEAAAARGARVSLISGPTDLPAPAGVDMVRVETVEQMLLAVLDSIGKADVFISAAAPADFAPAQVSHHKIKKPAADAPHVEAHWTLELDRTQDILATVGARKGKTVLVGFAAETENLEQNAAEKLTTKNLDLIVANDVSSESEVFGSDTNQVTLISRTGETLRWPRMSKHEVADGILSYIRKSLVEADS